MAAIKRRLSGQSQKYSDRFIHAGRIAVAQLADTAAKPVFADSQDFVSHHARWFFETIRCGRFDDDAKQGQFGGISGEAADSDGFQNREMLVLENKDRPRLARVVNAGRARPDFDALHAGAQSEIASTQAWSSAA